MVEPYISFNSREIHFYSYYHDRRRGGSSLTGRAVHERVHGLSRASIRRMKRALFTLIDTARWKSVYVRSTGKRFRYKINFVTLTLPSAQVHTDQEIVRVALSPLLELWTKKIRGFLYFWKAEVQDNGNVHFHVTTNSFLHHRTLRTQWNKAINKLGYVDRCKVADPNSTDVHAVSKIRNLIGYMVKYMTKADRYTRTLRRYHSLFGARLKASSDLVTHLPKKYFSHIKRYVTCRIWSCSKVLSNCTVSMPEHTRQIADDVRWLNAHSHLGRKTDYCLSFYLDQSFFDFLPDIAIAWSEKFEKLILLQYQAMVSTVVDEL